MKELTVDGLRLVIEHKAVRNINLRIRPDGSLYVSLPRLAPDAQAIAFVRSKRAWIDSHLAQRACRQRERQAAPLAEGTPLPLWGEALPLRLVPGTGRSAAARTEAGLVLSGPQAASAAGCRTLLRRFYADELLAALPRLIPEAEAATGLHAAQWRIKLMKSRWGSCNSRTAVIAVNATLAGYPEAALRLVLLHELTHLRHPNHGPGFYADLDKAAPRWREADALLKADPQKMAFLFEGEE